MTDQDSKRAQGEALHAAEKSTPGDRGRAHEDALARYLRMQAAPPKKRQHANKNAPPPGK